MTDPAIAKEGENLGVKFASLKVNGRKTIAHVKFAADHKIKGGASMIHQHIIGHRPMNLDAAVKYAKAFNCPLEEISPRLALEAKRAAASVAHLTGVGNEPPPIVAQPRTIYSNDSEEPNQHLSTPAMAVAAAFEKLNADQKAHLLDMLRLWGIDARQNSDTSRRIQNEQFSSVTVISEPPKLKEHEGNR